VLVRRLSDNESDIFILLNKGIGVLSMKRRVSDMPCQPYRSSGHLHHLTVTYNRTIHCKPKERAHLVPALLSCCARIHMQTTQFRIVHHFQDMRVSRNEQSRSMLIQQQSCLGGISGRIAADMDHQHLQILTGPAPELRMDRSDIISINVAIHTGQRLEIRQSIR